MRETRISLESVHSLQRKVSITDHKQLTTRARAGLPQWLRGKEPQAMQIQSLGQEDPLEEGMATHSSILAWRIPWREEPCGL